MRRLVLALVLAACAREGGQHLAAPIATPPIAPGLLAALPQYLVADPSAAHKSVLAVALGTPNLLGVVVDRRRIVVGQGEPRVAGEETAEPIVGAAKLPARFGGGFLFHTATSIFRAASFDGHLVPVVSFPEAIEKISFGPTAILARTQGGERWGLALPSGDRARVGPLGFADIEALDDGRAVSFDDQGSVSTSIDGGAHWMDVTAQMKSAPSAVRSVNGDLWLDEKVTGSAWRLEHDGHLAWFAKAPQPSLIDLRPKDPRWRGQDTPLRAVFRTGMAIDDSTGLVLDAGDFVRVDLRTGEVKSVVPAHLPPDARCQALPATGDGLFACVIARKGAGGNSAFVVAHALEVPIVEQSWSEDGQFYASDDGGLAFSGSCQGVPPSSSGTTRAVVCVRTPGGRWEEHDLSATIADGGSSDLVVARWIPRADGGVVALVAEPTPALYDAITQNLTVLTGDVRDALDGSSTYRKHGKSTLYAMLRTPIVDTSWTFTNGSRLRGWQHSEIVEIDDGRVTRSPYNFDVAGFGAYGLGRGPGGRLYQSDDHGATWTEVATPVGGAEALDLDGCSNAGCDLGAFYRVGWLPRPPSPEPARTTTPDPALVQRTKPLTFVCKANGGVTSRMLPRTNDSPEDLGLGAVRLPVAGDKSTVSFVRAPLEREVFADQFHRQDSSDDDSAPSPRALLSGIAMDPEKNPLAVRRGFSFLVPFEPSGRIVRTSIAMSDVVAAGRRIGMTSDEILSEDATESGKVIPLTPLDPNQPTDLVLHNADRGMLAIARGERMRVVMRSSRGESSIVSGVSLPNDEQAFLELEGTGSGHVYKVSGGSIVDLFDVGTPGLDELYPANVDALALGPKNELVILRTPSGGDPPSSFEPAYVFAPATPAIALAPWTEAKLADDPACKGDPGGYRATIQTAAPWIKLTNPDLRVSDTPALLRVRWTTKHACIEGFEVRLPSTTLRLSGAAAGEPVTFATWLVAKGGSFARVSVSEGIEWRQPLECAQ